MASVQEKVATFNVLGKLYSPVHRPPDHRLIKTPQEEEDAQPNSAQNRAVWSAIVAALQAQVTVKKRRQYLRSHEDCFLGCDAVDVIQTHLAQKQLLGDARVSRAAAARVCQALLERRVFEAVGGRAAEGKRSKAGVFQDSGGVFYRFLRVDARDATLSPPSDERLMDVTPHRPDVLLFSHSTPVKPDQELDRLMEKLDLTGFVGSPPMEHLPPSVVREVWHEQTVKRLSQLIDLPLLEGVLNCAKIVSPPSRGSNNEPDLLYTSSYLDREVLKAFKESQADDWLSAAIELLDFLPDQLVVEVSRELPTFSSEEEEGHVGPSGRDECKLLLFHVLDKHYGRLERKPLLCDGTADVYTQIMELLVNGKFERALEVLQLMLKLLSASAREELRRLLEFMAQAADAASVRLHREMENRMVVKNTFTRAVVQSKSLTKGKVDLLMLFMLDNHQEIFKIPGSLHKLVSEKLDDIVKNGGSSATDVPFCQRIPRDVYTETVKDVTKNELYSLLKNIDKNTKYSTKEKNRLLSQFYQGHPDLFTQYFGSRLSSLNLLEV